MAFVHISAPDGTRPDEMLPADNLVPERHLVIDLLRQVAPKLGLNTSVITTLDAMLSCLPPRRTHHTVFASNATLIFRRNGISDRTLRRHAAILQEAGLLVRRDSPNRKRFTRHNSIENKTLRFGFDLTPLFARLREFAAKAAETAREQEEIAYLRCKIRARTHNILSADPTDPYAISTLKALRRKLSLAACNEILERLETVRKTEDYIETSDEVVHKMSGNDGQNVRHYHKSKEELIDIEAGPNNQSPATSHTPHVVSVDELLVACPEAAQFSLRKIECFSDAIHHARTLAPMMGIDSKNYAAAESRLGVLRTAMTIWVLMQFHNRIQRVGAYFRAITVGERSATFAPEALVRRLARTHGFQTSADSIVRGQPHPT